MDALPQLVAKTLAAEKRALICCAKTMVQQLSSALWGFGQDSWLPHGIAGVDEGRASLCPIWFTDDAGDNANQAGFIFLLNGMEHDASAEVERVFILFDGGDESAVASARNQWKTMREDGHELSYWTQDNLGKWAKTA